MQLINITSTPIEYKINIEAARLEMKQSDNPRYQMEQNQGKMNIDFKNIQVRLDSTRLRESLNLRGPGAFARYYGGQGQQTAYENIGERVQFGNQMAQIKDGVSISQLVQQKAIQQPTTYTTFIPSAGWDISWQPQELNLDYQPTEMNFDWQVQKNVMEYVPGKYQMDILQYPKVEIEYLGSPTYVPPSADPNYGET